MKTCGVLEMSEDTVKWPGHNLFYFCIQLMESLVRALKTIISVCSKVYLESSRYICENQTSSSVVTYHHNHQCMDIT